MKKIISSVFVLFLLLTSCSNDTNKPNVSVPAPTDTDKKAQTAQSIAPIGEGSAIITPADYQKFINITPIVLVDFSATWCGPCKRLSPRIDELVNEMPGKFTLVKSDVDRDGELAEVQGITAMPTLMLYKNGKLVWRNEGLVEKGLIADKIAEAEKN